MVKNNWVVALAIVSIFGSLFVVSEKHEEFVSTYHRLFGHNTLPERLPDDKQGGVVAPTHIEPSEETGSMVPSAEVDYDSKGQRRPGISDDVQIFHYFFSKNSSDIDGRESDQWFPYSPGLIDLRSARKLLVCAYADSMGGSLHNMKLSAARAKNAIVSLRALSSTEISMEHFGETVSVGAEVDEHACSANRRVDLIIISRSLENSSCETFVVKLGRNASCEQLDQLVYSYALVSGQSK